MSGETSLFVPLTLPVGWQAGPAASGPEASNAALRVLATAVTLAERAPPVTDEATGLELEVARLHQKTQLLVELLALALGRDATRPAATNVELGSSGCRWRTAAPPRVGSEGQVVLWLHAAAPEPLLWPATITRVTPEADGAALTEAALLPLGEAAQAALERHVFQLHRRAVAEARAARR